MKIKLIINSFLAFFISFTSFSQSQQGITIKSGDIEIDIDVNFGRKKLECKKFGICEFPDITGEKKITSLSYNTQLNMLVFKVEIEGLKASQSDKIQYLEGKSNIVIEEEWSLPKAIEEKLKLPNKFVCKKGTYPVQKFDKYYLIGFSLNH